MKGLLTLFVFALSFITTVFAQGGPDCISAAASPILALPFNASTQTTCGMGNNYNDQNSTVCGIPLYLDGEDYLYAYTPSAPGVMSILIFSGSSNLGVTVYDDCPSTGMCLASAQGAAGIQFLFVNVQAGTTYYIMVDSWPNPICHPDFEILIPPLAPLPPPTIQDCGGAIPVCQDVYQELNSPLGEGNYPNEINGGINGFSCLGSGEVNGIWYTFTVQTTGDVCFSITPNNFPDDYDWAVYNLTNNPCEDIFTDQTLEVSCNFEVNSGVTGPNGLPGLQNEPCIPVITGETYAVYVSNFGQSPSGYTLDFGIPGSTAVIFDNSPPIIDTVYWSGCDYDSFTFEFSENVLCFSIQDADFSLTGPGGPYTVSNIFGNSCNSGGTQDILFTFDVAPPLSQTGLYTFSIVDDVQDLCGNITNSFDYDLNLPGAVNLAVIATDVDCQDTTAQGQIDALAVGGIAPHEYSIGAGGQPSGTFLNVPPGNYTVTVQDSAGCSADTTVTIFGITTTMTNDTIVIDESCFGLADGTIIIETTGNGGPWDYVWEDANMIVIQNTVGSIGDTLYAAGPGTYTVTIYEGPNGSGCFESFVLTIVGPPPLQNVLSNDTTICIGGSATLTAVASGGTAPFDYIWDNGLPNGSPQVVSPTVFMQYAVYAQDANNCTSLSDTIEVDLNGPLSITTSGNDTICPNSTTTLIVTNATGGDGGPYTYDWGNGPSSDNTYDVTPSVSTTYCVTVSDGCETPDTTACFDIELEITADAIFSVDTTEGCTPFPVTFTDLSDPNQVVQQDWSFGDGSTGTGSPVSHNYGLPGTYDVTLTITTNNGCTDDTTVTDLISVILPPEAAFTGSPQPTTIIETEIIFTNYSSNNTTNDWDFGGLGTSQDVNPSFTFPNLIGDTYPVTLVVTNALGCEDEITVLIEIRDELAVYIPNAFTPNGDGVNDWFYVNGNDIDPEEFLLQVFNRWGQLVFETEDPQEPWFGSMNNNGDKTVQDGIYAYRVEARSYSTKIKSEYLGHVTLLNGSFTQ